MRFSMPYFFFFKKHSLESQNNSRLLISEVNSATLEIQPRTELILSYPLEINKKKNTTVWS